MTRITMFAIMLLEINNRKKEFDMYTNGHKVWYAVLKDNDDNDWGTGSFSRNEAVRMAKDFRDDGFVDAYIAVIDNGNDPVCVNEIRDF